MIHHHYHHYTKESPIRKERFVVYACESKEKGSPSTNASKHARAMPWKDWTTFEKQPSSLSHGWNIL